VESAILSTLNCTQRGGNQA